MCKFRNANDHEKMDKRVLGGNIWENRQEVNQSKSYARFYRSEGI